jgi:O-antigen ligase
MNINTKHRQITLCALVFLLFASFSLSYAISSITIFLFLAFFFFDTKTNVGKKIKKITKDKIVLAYVIFFLVQVIGYFYSENTDIAMRRIEVLIPLLFLPAVLSTEPLSQTYLSKVLNIIKITIPLTFVLLLMYHLMIIKRDLNTFVNFTITEEIGISQFYLAFILLIPIITCLKEISIGKNSLANIFIMLTNLGVVFLLGNKTTLLFLVIMGIFFTVRLYHKNKKKGLLVVLIFCIAVVSAPQLNIVQNRINVILKTTDFNFKTIVTKNKFTVTKNTLEHRVLIDYVAINAIKTALPFGYGTGDYLDALFTGYEDLKFKAGIHHKYNTHNQYLEEFLKTGIFGGFVFIYLIVLLLKEVRQNNLYSYIILFFAFACCFESFLFRQHGVIIFGFIIPFIIYNADKLEIKT